MNKFNIDTKNLSKYKYIIHIYEDKGMEDNPLIYEIFKITYINYKLVCFLKEKNLEIFRVLLKNVKDENDIVSYVEGVRNKNGFYDEYYIGFKNNNFMNLFLKLKRNKKMIEEMEKKEFIKEEYENKFINRKKGICG